MMLLVFLVSTSLVQFDEEEAQKNDQEDSTDGRGDEDDGGDAGFE